MWSNFPLISERRIKPFTKGANMIGFYWRFTQLTKARTTNVRYGKRGVINIQLTKKTKQHGFFA